VIVGDLPSVMVGGELIDDLLIEAKGIAIDGPSGILGQAGPTNLRPAAAGASAFLPAKGITLPNLQLIAERGLLMAAPMHRHTLPIFSPKVLPDDSLVV
jgi:hypothetical protein